MINIHVQISAIAKTDTEKTFFNATTSFSCFEDFLLSSIRQFYPKKGDITPWQKPENRFHPSK
jgi:hypothetical protein